MRGAGVMRRQRPVRRGVCLAVLSFAVAVAASHSAKAQSVALQEARAPGEASSTVLAAARRYFPDEDKGVSPKRIFRLTRDQIDATVRGLLPGYVTQSIKEVMPKDPLQTNYEYAELLSFNAANHGVLSQWIGDIAARVRKSPAGVIDCKASANSSDCLKTQARAFVVKAFRGDVANDKIEQITAFYLQGVARAGFEQATGDLVEVVLSSPHFLFRKEIDINRRGRLSPAQHLQALSYTIADAPPDTLGLASQDALQYLQTEPATYKTIDRIVASPQSREKLVRFFKAWLEIKEPGEFRISKEVFPEFDARLAQAMLEETDRFLRAQLSKPSPKLGDITQSQQSFVSKPLETIYGTRSADPAGNRPVGLDPSQRFGIFSQPAVLASHSGPTGTQPIKRGVFWVRKVMCMELLPPPQGLDISLYETAPTTERKRIEQSTRQSACAGCHKIIDPFGFFQESYDPLGRWRTEDNGFAVDTSILIDFLDEDPASTNGPVEALRTLTSSLMFKQCFVRQMFRFYMGRQEEPSDDPLLRRMFVGLAGDETQDILKLVGTLAASDRLGQRW
jgi:hypothetical protein